MAGLVSHAAGHDGDLPLASREHLAVSDLRNPASKLGQRKKRDQDPRSRRCVADLLTAICILQIHAGHNLDLACSHENLAVLQPTGDARRCRPALQFYASHIEYRD